MCDAMGNGFRDESMFCESHLDEILRSQSNTNESHTTLTNYFYYLYDNNDVPYVPNAPNGLHDWNDTNTSTCHSQFENDFDNSNNDSHNIGMLHDMDICYNDTDMCVFSESNVSLNLNGTITNGLDVNGMHTNSLDVNDSGVNGTNANRTITNGLDVNGPDVNGSGMNATNANGADVNGSNLNVPIVQSRKRSNGNSIRNVKCSANPNGRSGVKANRSSKSSNENPISTNARPSNHQSFSQVSTDPSNIQQKARRGCDKTKMFVPSSDEGRYTKKLCCIYCLKRYPKLARHILSVHKTEDDVKIILALPPVFNRMANSSNQPIETQRIVIVPGMGCVPVRECNWYTWLHDKLANDPTGRFTVVLEDMPGPHGARESRWLPFIRDTLKFDTILIGHSSGCAAIMRQLETDRVRGVILVAACHTDLRDENERASEYFSRPWDWDTMRSNAGWIVQLHSTSDHCIPEEEGRFVADKLESEYMKLELRGNFMGPTLPEVLKVIRKKCQL